MRTPHYLLGDRFTAADVIIGSQLGWGMLFGVIPKRDEFVGYMAAFRSGLLGSAPLAQMKKARLAAGLSLRGLESRGEYQAT